MSGRRAQRDLSLAEAISEELARERITAGHVPPFLEWALRIPEPKTGTLDFERFPFQRELYESAVYDARLVIQKAAQVGISAFGIRSVLYPVDVHALTGLYVFPKRSQLAHFSKTRIHELFRTSTYLQSRRASDDTFNMLLLRICSGGHLYLRGSDTPDDLDAIAADVLALDEYDRLNPDLIPDAERRLSASADGRILRFGTPSVPGFGISDQYEQSDQRRWHVRCTHCRERWQTIEFNENFDLQTATIVCRGCRKPLDVSAGRWVPTHPGRDVRGYHVSQLLVPKSGLLPLLVKRSESNSSSERETFFRKDLGEPYVSDENRLSLAALQAAVDSFPMQDTYGGDFMVTAGIDVASTRSWHMRVSAHPDNQTKICLFVGEVSGPEEVIRRLRAFRVHLAVIDHLPEQGESLEIAGQYDGIVLLAHPVEGNDGTIFRPHFEMGTVAYKRTPMFDRMFQRIRLGGNRLPRDVPAEYMAHMQALVRVIDEDARGGMRAFYRRSGRRDDYASAEMFDELALMCCQELLWIRGGASAEDQYRDPAEDVAAWEEYHRRNDGYYSPGPPMPDDDYWAW